MTQKKYKKIQQQKITLFCDKDQDNILILEEQNSNIIDEYKEAILTISLLIGFIIIIFYEGYFDVFKNVYSTLSYKYDTLYYGHMSIVLLFFISGFSILQTFFFTVLNMVNGVFSIVTDYLPKIVTNDVKITSKFLNILFIFSASFSVLTITLHDVIGFDIDLSYVSVIFNPIIAGILQVFIVIYIYILAYRQKMIELFYNFFNKMPWYISILSGFSMKHATPEMSSQTPESSFYIIDEKVDNIDKNTVTDNDPYEEIETTNEEKKKMTDNDQSEKTETTNEEEKKKTLKEKLYEWFQKYGPIVFFIVFFIIFIYKMIYHHNDNNNNNNNDDNDKKDLPTYTRRSRKPKLPQPPLPTIPEDREYPSPTAPASSSGLPSFSKVTPYFPEPPFQEVWDSNIKFKDKIIILTKKHDKLYYETIANYYQNKRNS